MKKYYCVECGIEIGRRAVRCLSCAQKLKVENIGQNILKT